MICYTRVVMFFWKKAKSGGSEPAQVDPVCGMRVNPARARSATLVVRHGEEEFYFCGEGCKRVFEGSPEQYVRH